MKTTDGGQNWAAQSSGTGDNFYATAFTNALNGVAVGDNGLIARTTDGGATWSLVSVPVYAYWRAVWFMDTQTGYITGGLSGTTGNILKTTDGGATWKDISPSSSPASDEVIYSIFFTNTTIGYATNYDGYILKTIDGGASWTAQFVSGNHLWGLYFTDANTGYCVGGDQDLNTTVILKTTNAGLTWTAQNNLYPAANSLIDVEFADANTGYAIGGNFPVHPAGTDGARLHPHHFPAGHPGVLRGASEYVQLPGYARRSQAGSDGAKDGRSHP